jgi:ribose 5-phosphate isomerase A
MTTQSDLTPLMVAKKAAGKAAAELIQEGMLVGLGTGSTAAFFIEALGKRCQEGLKISAVATSQHSTRQAQQVGIPLEDPEIVTSLDITVDGADEMDHHKNMIKGGGGALLREKLLAQASHEMIVVIDETKLVNQLGAALVPVEVTRFVYHTTFKRLEAHGYQGVLRCTHDYTPFITDNGNYIVDIQYNTPILDPMKEHERLKSLTGVIETGLFFNIAKRVVIGYKDGFVKIRT